MDKQTKRGRTKQRVDRVSISASTPSKRFTRSKAAGAQSRSSSRESVSILPLLHSEEEEINIASTSSSEQEVVNVGRTAVVEDTELESFSAAEDEISNPDETDIENN